MISCLPVFSRKVYSLVLCYTCTGEGIGTLAVLHVLPTAPPSGPDEHERELGRETAGALPQ